MQIADYPSFLNIHAGMSLTALVSAIFNFLLMVAGLAAFVMIVWGGIGFLTSAGDPSKTGDAKNRIFSAILGLIIIFSSWMILNTINPDLVNLREPSSPPPPETRQLWPDGSIATATADYGAQEDAALLNCQEVLDMFTPEGDEEPISQWNEVKNCSPDYNFYYLYIINDDVYLEATTPP